MILYLKKPIKDSNGKYIKKLEYDFESLTIKDLNNVEKLYFSLTQGLRENVLYKCDSVYMHLCFFVACAIKNKDLSFVNFMKISGRDQRNIIRIAENNTFWEELKIKKKDIN